MKTKKITLVSHYYEKRLTLRVPAESADRLSIDERDRIKLVNWDCYMCERGYNPHLLTPWQVGRIDSFFGATTDYFDRVIVHD